MEIRKYTVNGNEVTFVNEFVSTRSGFNHKSTMFINTWEAHSAVVHYINRTWECYTYQTSMLECVYKYKEWRTKMIKENYKYRKEHELGNPIQLRGKFKEEVEEKVRTDDDILFCDELKEILKNNNS